MFCSYRVVVIVGCFFASKDLKVRPRGLYRCTVSDRVSCVAVHDRSLGRDESRRGCSDPVCQLLPGIRSCLLVRNQAGCRRSGKRLLQRLRHRGEYGSNSAHVFYLTCYFFVCRKFARLRWLSAWVVAVGVDMCEELT